MCTCIRRFPAHGRNVEVQVRVSRVPAARKLFPASVGQRGEVLAQFFCISTRLQMELSSHMLQRSPDSSIGRSEYPMIESHDDRISSVNQMTDLTYPLRQNNLRVVGKTARCVMETA